MASNREQHPQRPVLGVNHPGRFDLADIRAVLLMAIAAITAIVVLVFDHYNEVSDLLIILSSVLLLGAVALLFGLSIATHRARANAAEMAAIRSASIEAASYAVVTLDREGVIVEWNRAATVIFGFDRTDAIGRDAIELVVPTGHRDEYRTNLLDYADGADRFGFGNHFEVQLHDSLRRVFPVEISIVRIPTGPEIFTVFGKSLTERRIREEENRRLADIVRSSEDAVISVDLDGRVTSWNRGAENLYGYSDSEATSKRLNDLTFPRDSQALGPLFRRVLNGISGEMTTERRNQEGQALWVTSRAFPIKDVEGRVAGMSLISRDVTDQRKEAAATERQKERQHWRSMVKSALSDSEMTLLGQPVYRMSTGEISHHELLIRMNRNGEVYAPGAFLPHVENSDLMTDIDCWVIGEGARLARDMPVAINLSGYNVSDPTFGPWIADAIDQAGARPEDVRFEITESTAIENMVAARKLVGEMKRIGSKVSLDDFGTGYGSFTYLKHLPADEIKIDMSFIQDLATDEASQRVVNSLIAVARNFSLSTVAEGVEDQETEDVLRDLGVDLAQGYHLGHPKPVAEILAA